MKKSAKTTISTVTVVFVTIVAAVILVVFSLKNAPAKYLCEKYDFNRSQLKCVEYIPKHYFFDLNCWESGWTTSTWIFSYDGKEFIVKNIDDEYYDDYQFDEYCNWCIDYLNFYLSENVVSVTLNSENFFDKNKKFTENDFKRMLSNIECPTVFVTFEDIVSYAYDQEKAKQVGDNVKEEIKHNKILRDASVIIVDKSIKFETEIPDFCSEGDRVYLTYHYLTEDFRDLQKQKQLIYTNQL